MYEVQRGETEVKCPYFKRQDKLKIVCEGFSDGFNTALEFPSRLKKSAYIQKHCSSISGCEECPLHKILDEKWGVGTTNGTTI